MLRKDAFNSEYFNSFEYRETYNSGDDRVFEKFVRKVESERLQKVLKNARNLLKSNSDQFYFSALDFLGKIIKEYLSGKQDINGAFDWEMLGRAFETIAERFLENVSVKAKNSFREAKGYALLCFESAGNKNRYKRLYEMFNIGDTDIVRRGDLLEDLDFIAAGEAQEETLDFRSPGKALEKEDVWEEDWGDGGLRKPLQNRNNDDWTDLDSNELTL